MDELETAAPGAHPRALERQRTAAAARGSLCPVWLAWRVPALPCRASCAPRTAWAAAHLLLLRKGGTHCRRMCSSANTAQELTGLSAGGAAAAGQAAALPASARPAPAAAAPAHEAIDLTGSDDEAARHAPAGRDPAGNPGVPDYGLLGLPLVLAGERAAAPGGSDGGGGFGDDHLWGYSPALAALEASRRPDHGALAGIEAAVARPGEPADPARASAASLAQAEATEASLRGLRVSTSPHLSAAGGPSHLQLAPTTAPGWRQGPVAALCHGGARAGACAGAARIGPG